MVFCCDLSEKEGFCMKRVSGVKFWLLGILTEGIYSLVIWGRMANNLNAMARKVGEKQIRSFFGAFLLGFITFGIYPVVWTFKFAGLASRLNARVNAGIAPSGAFGIFIMGFIPIYSFFWLANMNNTLIDAYKKIR